MLEFAAYAIAAAQLAVIARALALRLGSRFRCFLAYLLADVVFGSVAAARFSVASTGYRAVWIASQWSLFAIFAAAAWETVVRLSEGYPAFAPKRRELGLISGLAGIVIGLWIAWPRRLPSLMAWTWFASEFVSLSIAVAMVCANLFFALAPAPARRNSILHARIFAVLTMINVVSLFTMHDAPHATQLGFALGSFVCYGAWVVSISRKGDLVEPLPGMTEEEEAAQLRRLDQEISRLRRM